MKKTIVLLLLIFGIYSASAQAWTGIDDQKAQAGLNIWGKGHFGVVGTFDYGVAEAVSIGAGAAIYTKGPKDRADRGRAEFSVFGRADYHLMDALALGDNFDIYPGITMGIMGSSFDFGVHLGARLFFTKNIGAFAEIGNRGSIGIVFGF